MKEFKTMSLKLVDDLLNDETADVKESLNLIITILRDNAICDDIYYLLNKLEGRLTDK